MWPKSGAQCLAHTCSGSCVLAAASARVAVSARLSLGRRTRSSLAGGSLRGTGRGGAGRREDEPGALRGRPLRPSLQGSFLFSGPSGVGCWARAISLSGGQR